jgi:hypothetical protein
MPDARDVYREKPSQDEIDDVLEQRVSAAVGTINPDGSVHLAYVLFLREGIACPSRRRRRHGRLAISPRRGPRRCSSRARPPAAGTSWWRSRERHT